jgi:hypothetical protein
MNFAHESIYLFADNVPNEVVATQITGCVENAVPLHADIPCTGGRGSGVPFEAVLQEYLQFPYEYFLLFFFLSGVTVINSALQTTPEEKIVRIKIE